jgi:hypothetical protein
MIEDKGRRFGSFGRWLSLYVYGTGTDRSSRKIGMSEIIVCRWIF